jgi:hypothetical protein
MNIAYTPQDAVIDTVAIILILLPEPTTTALGIAMMARPRGNNNQARASRRALRNYPDYVYRVDNIRGREIIWEAKIIMPGQLSLQKPNKADVKLNKREQLLYSRTESAQQLGQATAPKLPPGVKVHHTLIKPPREVKAGSITYTGEIIHHTMRDLSQVTPAGIKQTSGIIMHHSIENSPGYLIAQNADKKGKSSNTVIHHTLKNAPAAHINNQIKIIKPPPVIKQHHTINLNPPLSGGARLIQPPVSKRREPIIRKIDKP